MNETPSNPSMDVDSEEAENNNAEELTNKLENDNTKTEEQLERERQEVKTKLINHILSNEIDSAFKIIDESHIPDEVLQSPEVQERALANIIYQLSERHNNIAIKIIQGFNISDEVIQSSLKVEIIKCLSGHKIDRAIDIMHSFDISDEVIQSSEVQNAAKDRIIQSLSKGNIDLAIEIIKEFNISDEVIQSSEVQNAAKDRIRNYLSDGDIDLAIKTKENFKASDVVIQSEEIQEAAKNKLRIQIRNGDTVNTVKTKEKYHISNEVFESTIKEVLIKCFSEGPDDVRERTMSIDSIDYAVKIRNNFKISNEIFRSAAEAGISNCLSKNKDNRATYIKERFRISDEVFESLVKTGIIHFLSVGEIFLANSDREKFHISYTVFQSVEAQEAAKAGIIQCLSVGGSSDAVKIKEELKIPDEVIQSEEVQNAAKVGLIKLFSCKDYYGVTTKIRQIKQDICISDEVFQSAESDVIIQCLSNSDFDQVNKIIDYFPVSDEVFQSAAKAGIINCISGEENDRAIQIKAEFHISDEVFQEVVNNCIDQYANSENYIKILKLPNEFRVFISNEILKKAYTEATEKEITDPQIITQLEFFKKCVGDNRLSDILINNSNFWNNIHDNLLFIQKLIELPDQQAEETARLIFPLLNSTTDFLTLNELLGYFSVEIYKEKNDGQLPPFVNFEHFAREAYLQRYNIEVPANASDNFRHALEHLISIRGVDIPFLRSLCETYAVNTAQSEDDNNNGSPKFAQKILNILEGKDNIDERKLIKPFSETLSLDPLNKIVFNAIGFHSLNNLTPKMIQYLNDPNGLGTVLALFESKDKETRKKIVEDRDNKISSEPDKKDRYIAEAKKQAELNTIVQHGSGSGNAESVNLRDIEDLQFRLGEEHVEIVKEGLNNAIYNSEDFRQICTRALTELAKRSETLDNVFDLNQFSDLVEAGSKLLKIDKDEINNISPNQLVSYFSGKEALLSIYLLWLSLNNQTRATQSADIKRKIDVVLNQKKYKELNDHLKQNGQTDEKSNATISYLQGKIEIDDIDENNIRTILKEFGYSDIGRSLEVMIAAGSDFTAWTCGDETNCCMPFTSQKNQEYLLRNDTAYFLTKLDDKIISQSVLVEGKNKKDGHTVTAIDNIEIANNAIKYRPAIAEAYKVLRQELISRHKNENYEIVIGTSYNDDGGSITGECELKKTTAKPIDGDLSYSDWAGHESNYSLYDSSVSTENKERYFGLQIDMFDRSRAVSLIESSQEKDEVKSILEKIGHGEDDGDGGLTFPDNYSCVIVDNEKIVGYIIAADYIKEENEDDLINIEKVRFDKSLSANQRNVYILNYLERKGLKENDNIDGIFISNLALEESSDECASILGFFSEFEQIKTNDGIKLIKKK